MRKFLTAVLFVFFSILAFAQTATDGTIKFLGIPVDGTKQNMITQLKSKGFQYFSHNDCLIGQFNGKDVEIHVVTNHDVVYRIYVQYLTGLSESRILSEYNTLLEQFNRNIKYVTPRANRPIPRTEHIAYEMSGNNKQYEAAYLYLSPDLFSEKEVGQIHQLMDKLKGMSEDEILESVDELVASLQISDAEEAESFVQKWLTLQNNCVWFKINGDYGNYELGIYYDNRNNQPNGEDL